MTSTDEQNWPSVLWLVRHGQSAGNVAREHAESTGGQIIDIALREMDVPLSPLGERQSLALGHWFGQLPPDQRPTVILTSPYARAQQTVSLIRQQAGLPESALIQSVDERLREKEFGLLDRLTKAGIMAQYPDQARHRSLVGKFYFRPPNGESWCDVILRLRSVSDDIQLQYSGERVLIVAHQIIVLCFRYLLERLTEQQVLEIDAVGDIANCSVTSYEFARDAEGRGGMSLRLYNHLAPLQQAGEPVTVRPDAAVAPK